MSVTRPPETPARWPWLLVAVYGVQLLLVAHAIAWHVDRPLGGLVPHAGGPGELTLNAMPTDREAARFRRGRTLELLEVNGREVCETPAGPRCGVAWARAQVDTTPGARNRFVVRVPPDSRTREVVLTAGPGELAAIVPWALEGILMACVGLAYAAIGILVWRRRPADPAALPFLLFSLALASTLGGAWHVDTPTLWMRALVALPSTVVMPLLFLFAHAFATRSDAWRTLRFQWQLVFALLVGATECASQLLSAHGVPAARSLTALFTPLVAAGTIVALGLSLHSTWRAARSPSPLSHRRRARVLALAMLLGFGYPILWLLLRDTIYVRGHDRASYWALLTSFAALPALIGYAMVRHRMFDLRIVVRQGLVYGVLSALLALAYVALVVTAYRVVGTRESAVAPVFAAVVVAVLFGVVRVRLERWIDAMVFRGREVFRRAIESSGKALSQARSPHEVAPALRPALLDALGLQRAYVIERGDDPEQVYCHTVGNEPDPETGSLPPPLPEELPLGRHQGLTHCLRQAEPVQSVDAAVPTEADGLSMWDRYHVEVSVPFGRLDDGWPAGVLLLGPKESGRPFDPEDLRLVAALGTQLSLALASARAFERLAASGRTLLRLTQGIVHEANTPLGVLHSSVDTLARAVDHLAVAEDAARRTRLLAGARASMQSARSSADRLGSLIGDLKEFVNLEESERVATDLRACLTEVVGEAQRKHGRPIEVSTPDGAALVDGYPTKLRHVFAGIVDNALVASEEGQPVQVSLRRDGRYWLATVRDQGTGIAPETLLQVFDFGIAAKRSQKRMGLRIGLPYAKRVVESLGGLIRIRSQLHHGTEVRINLPACNDAPHAS